MDVVLAVDQGSSSTKVLALDEETAVIASAHRPLSSTRPGPGLVELDPQELWASVEGAVRDCLAALPAGARVRAVGLANQRETAVCFDRRTGEAHGPGISWQDQRGSELCDAARRALGEEKVAEVTGLPISTSYSAAKFAWLLAQSEGRADLVVGTVDSYLSARLCPASPHRCEIGNASRTGLFDLSSLAWSLPLLDAFQIPPDVLPEVVASTGELGACSGIPELEDARLTGWCGDSHAALFSHHARDGASLKASYGTGSSVISLTARADAARAGLARSVVWHCPELAPATLPGSPVGAGAARLALEGNVLSAGEALQWTAGLLGAASVERLEAMAISAGTAAQVLFVPALVGLGSPWLDPDARAWIEGLDLRSGPGNVAFAAIEAIAQLVCDVAERFGAGTPDGPEPLHVDGEASRSDLLLQLQADLLGAPVVRPELRQAPALGAGYLAGIGEGLWSVTDLGARPARAKVFEPRISRDEREHRRARWRAAVARCVAAGETQVGHRPHRS